MKKRSVAVTLLLLICMSAAFAQGWRKGESEVCVTIGTQADLDKLKAAGLFPEPASANGHTGRLYLVPAELARLQATGIPYTVTIADLNSHFEYFWDNPLVPPGYYTYENIIAIADSLATNFPAICKKVMWGTSMGGRQLAALKISDNPDTDENEPEIMFDGGIHGDEVGGAQNVIMYARDLCLAYGTDPAITDLITTREIWLYLMVNPDGRVAMSRYNNNGVDCNRDNGYMWNQEGNSSGAWSQIETKALRNCIFDNQFVVYTNYHSGTETISYPWSYRSEACRDVAQINNLAGVYSTMSGYTNLPYGQGYNIMYAINGSTKDAQYGSLGNIGWSIEISNDKQPPSSMIGFYYTANKSSMTEMVKRCGWGVEGLVTDSVTGQPVRATVWVNNYFPVYTDPVVGDYHKFVLQGTYTLKISANGYQTKTVTGVAVPFQGSVVTNVQLKPDPHWYAYRVISCRIPGNNFGDEGYTPGAIGKPDSVPYALGRNGWIVLDMGDTLRDGPGPDFKVWQSGTTQKAFSVMGGNTMDGPFTNIGNGTGTTSFDLSGSGLTKARYLYIKDGGSGAASGAGAGFNLDAVEMLTIPVTAGFAASSPAPCAGQTVTFTDQSTGNPTSWNWSFPGGNPTGSALQNPSPVTYVLPGTYNVSLTVTNSYSSSTLVQNACITAVQPPVASLGPDTTICAWNTLTLDAGNPGATYLWTTGATTQAIVIDSTGTGLGTTTVGVTVFASPGCQASDQIAVTFDDCTGVSDAVESWSVHLRAVPSDRMLVADFTAFDNAFWQLFSAQGACVASGKTEPGQRRLTVGTGHLPSGLYIFRIMKEGKSWSGKVICTR